MEFLAPFLLWGLAGAAVPVALHFIGRANPIVHRFSALRFIQRSQKNSARALKLRHILVLLLRILGVALAALALARPILPDGAIPIGWSLAALMGVVLLGLAAYAREPLAALGAVVLLFSFWMAYPREQALADRRVRGDFAIVVDQSMSMAYAEAQHTRFELAQRQVNELLKSLTPDSRVALILATDVAERSLGRLSYRHEIVAKKLESARPLGRGLNIDRALQAAEDILRRDASERPPFIVLLTDLQAANLANARAALRKSGERPSSGALTRAPSLIIVPVGSDHARNSAVLAAQVQQTELQADSRARLQVRLKPSDPARPLLVELFIDQQRVDQKLIPPDGRDVIDIELPFQTGPAGLHTGRVNLPEGDRLALDQERFFVYSAGRPAGALLIEPPSPQPDKSKAFFLKAALQPTDGGLNATGLVCDIQPPRELNATLLSRYRAVILSEAISMSGESWNALKKWVQEGGGLMLWAGPGAAIDNLRRNAFEDATGHAPLLPGVLHGLTSWEKPPALSVSQPEHPVLSRFSPGVLTILRETQISRMLRVVPDPRDTGNIILSAGGLPLLTESIYGRGRVLFFSIDPALESSDLPKRGEAYVTLALNALRYLAERENNVSAQLGQSLTLELSPRPANGQVFWKKPGAVGATTLQADTDPAPASPSPLTDIPLTLVVPPLDQPGIHAFSWFTAGSEVAQNRLVAVNVDPLESDLARADDALVKDLFAAWKPVLTPKLMNALETQAGQGRIRSQDFSAALLLLLAGLLIAESFFANRLYPSMESDPAPASNPAASARITAPGGAHG